MTSPAEVCARLAVGFAAMAPLTLLASGLDRRTLDGAGVWRKPFKFEVSLAIHFATLAWVLSRTSPDIGNGAVAATTVALAIVSAVFEMTYIVVQAARAERSHFNLATPLYAALYAAMAVGAVIISGAYGIVAFLVAVDAGYDGPPVMRFAAALGLGVASLATIVTGFAMGARLRRHVGEHDDGAGTWPVTGWSRSTGDLRVPHFVANHVAQVMLVVGYLTSDLRPEPLAHAVVALAAGAGAGVVVVTLRGALAGRPLLLVRRVARSTGP